MTERRGKYRIGVISDTHGLMRPQALAALQGAERIIHAGDVGGPDILEALRRIAPLTAVRGNTDHGSWADVLPRTAVAEVGQVSIFVIHDILDLDLDPAASGFAAVVFGHSHRPEITERDGVTFLNPGAAGPRRFELPVSVAIIDVNGAAIRASHRELEV